MSIEELNFKKLSNEKYRIYRLLQSPSAMGETYRKRIKEVGNYRGAIIFPEQFISLYGQSICRVSLLRTLDSVSGTASIIRSFSLCGYGHDKSMNSFDDVLEVERKCTSSATEMQKMFTLALQRPKEDTNYYPNIDLRWDAGSPTYWFSNKSDGLSFLRKNIKL